MDGLLKKHIVVDGYGFDVFCNEEGKEVCRGGTGMAERERLFSALDLMQALLGQGEEVSL